MRVVCALSLIKCIALTHINNVLFNVVPPRFSLSSRVFYFASLNATKLHYRGLRYNEYSVNIDFSRVLTESVVMKF